MKKQIKKLSLNKKTISNLISSEMSRVIGGGSNTSWGNVCCGGGTYNSKYNTCGGKTCNKQCTF